MRIDVRSHRHVATGGRPRWAVFLLATGCVFLFGAFIGASGRLNGIYLKLSEKLALVQDQKLGLLSKAASGLLAEPKHLLINIKFKHYQKLVEQRDRAIAAGVLTVTDEDYVPATIEHAGTSIPTKVRLKGDLSDHFADGEKWSFRFRARGENTLLGMKQFSLHHPAARNHLYEWFYQRALIREDVLGLRYDFVRVTFNGRPLGIYALEEHFEKRLVENNRRREGPIVRFSEDRLWQEWRHQKIPFSGARQNGSGSFLASEVDAFQSGRWTASAEMRGLHDKAIGLLRSFQRGELPTGDVFDVAKMATYLAVTDLMGAEHGARWHNTRFYYNPVTSRLEPIGFDGDAGRPISFLCIHIKDRHWSHNAWSSDPTYFEMLFRDGQLVEQYLSELQRVSQPEFIDTLLHELQDEIASSLRIIHSEDPSFEFSPEIFRRNQRYIRSVIQPVAPLAGYYHQVSPEMLELRLGNLQALPILVQSVTDDVDGESALLVSPAQITLPGRHPTKDVDFATVQVAPPDGHKWDGQGLAQLVVKYRIPGVDTLGSVPLTPWPFVSAEYLSNDILRRKPNAAEFEFIEIDQAAKIIRIKPGDWSVTDDVVFPTGYMVRCGPETRLHLLNGAMLLSRSPVEFIGSDESPVTIDSPDATGQGLAVLNAERDSRLEQVIFDSLRSPARDGWTLTGAVTFYESPLRISACQFVNNDAEDSLNIVRSSFSVERCLFTGAPSDALDADFCQGTITRSTFNNCGNDGIDVSGSIARIDSVQMNQTGDKGVSVGERSRVDAKDISIDQAKIGVAVKDSSMFVGDRIQVQRSQIGFALYRKKSEFGPASARVANLELDVKHDHLIEQGSSVTVDGRPIVPNQTQLADQLEPME